MEDRQGRKRLATRQRISDVATRLFMARGFDAVTVDEIATAADVSRMTVFNHFARKEDLFFDLDELRRQELVEAIEQRPAGVSAVEAVRLFTRRAFAERRPYARFFDPGTEQFMATLRASEVLQARARLILEELMHTLAEALAASVQQASPNALASLGAAMFVATWTVAITTARQEFDRNGDMTQASEVFLRLVDQGTTGVAAALAGTAYV